MNDHPTGREASLLPTLNDDGRSAAREIESRGGGIDWWKTFFEISPSSFFILGARLKLLYANPAFERAFGCTLKELKDKPVSLTSFVSPVDIRRLRSMVRSRVLLREGINKEVFRFIGNNGERYWGRLTLIPRRVPDNGLLLFGVIYDESELYRTREEAARKRSHMKKTIANLKGANRNEKEFVANITHELRTPLTTILITTEVLLRDAQRTLPPESRRKLVLILKNSRSLLDTINGLLDLAKLKKAGFRVHAKPVDISNFMEDLIEEMTPLFHRGKLDLSLEVMEKTPEYLSVDPDLLKKILMNLLDNARKFTLKGGTSVIVGPEEEAVFFRVTDTGVGIPPGETARIFEEFYQVDGSDIRRFSGTGLGLHIAGSLATLLGGRIYVESTAGEGSAFTLVLPTGRG